MQAKVVAPATGREGGVELLRILLMCFIIGHHLMVHGVGLFDGNNLTTFAWFRLALNSLFVIAVDCFIVISGFYGIRAKSIGLIKIFFQVWFFAISLGLLFWLLGKLSWSNKLLFSMILPISMTPLSRCYVTVHPSRLHFSPTATQL